MAWTKKEKPRSPKKGGFDVAKFGSARFDEKDSYTKKDKSSPNYTKKAKPS